MIKTFENFNSKPNIYKFDYDDPEFDHLNRHYSFVNIRNLEDLKFINSDNLWIGWETLSERFEYWFREERENKNSYYIRLNRYDGEENADALYFFENEKYIDEFYIEISKVKEWNPHGTSRRVDRDLWRHRYCRPNDLEYLKKEALSGYNGTPDEEAGLILYHYNNNKNLY